MPIERRGLGNALLEQQRGRLEQRVRLESLLHRPVQEQIGQGEKAHALVMGHERPDHGARFPARQSRRGVVDGFIEAVFAFQPFGGEPLQIQACLLGRHHQGERRGIRRNDQILGEPAFEPQAGHAERAVLVVEMNVDRVVAGFRNTPRQPALLSILDLPFHRRLVGLVEQGVFVGRHHQKRHEVLKHRTAPRKEDRLSTGGGEQAPQGKPAFLRQLPLRNRHETAQSRFRSQQIVVTRVPASLPDVVADGQQMTRLVVTGSHTPYRPVRRIAAPALRWPQFLLWPDGLPAVMSRRSSVNHSFSSGVASEPRRSSMAGSHSLSNPASSRSVGISSRPPNSLWLSQEVGGSNVHGARNVSSSRASRHCRAKAWAHPFAWLAGSASRLPASASAEVASRSRRSRAAASVVGWETDADARSFWS